ncbi:MAG: hypothetical protein CBE14_002860 [Rickettsiales bacterium TMED254]|nr:MAG: hypothetical protein CBE14_002860 [Rickettsiales bacterium TMED254]|tara:strand:- start:2446 stop:3120 length:675 start_codon:yes stop_codon:yes gene_type:complete
MELSVETEALLTNFAGINQNMLFTEGSTIKTMSEARNVLASANISEDIPREFGIYDLNEFLRAIAIVNPSPNIKFEDDNVLLKDSSGRLKIKYFYSSKETLTYPEKDIVMPTSDVSFVLENETFKKIKNATNAFGHSEMSISGTQDLLTLSVADSQNATSNKFSIDVPGKASSSNFNFIMNISNMKIIPGDYDVTISSKLISNFKHKDLNVQYWIALEKTSTFE